jgi:glycosyl transferase family 25
MSNLTCLEDIVHAYYINLETRVDRKEHVESQLKIMNIKADRFNAIKMDNGAIGCSISHLKILENAYKNNYDHVLILEDDILFLKPDLFKANFKKFMETTKNNWDVLLFAGNNVGEYDIVDDFCIKIKKCQTTTGYLVNGHYIKVLMNNVRMGLTQLIHKPLQHTLFAIDKFWFVLQENSKWFLITPLTVVQKEGYSDIEKKDINYSQIMLDLDKKFLKKIIPITKLPKKENNFISMGNIYSKKLM